MEKESTLEQKISPRKVKAFLGGALLVIIGIFIWFYYWGYNPVDFGTDDDKPYQFLFALQDAERLRRPMGVAISEKGWIYVTDGERNTVEVFDGNGKHRQTIGGTGKTEGKLNYPIAVAISPQQEIYVADLYNQRVQIFSTNGDFIKSFPDKTDAGKLGTHIMPTAITFDDEGRAFVVDVNLQRILVLDQHGKLERFFGQPGSAEGRLSYPNGIAFVSGKNWLVVSNSNNARVDIFSTKGEFVKTIVKPTELTNPRGVAWQADSELIAIVDNLSHMVKIADLKGNIQEIIGTRGLGDGQFNFPNHSAFDQRGRLYVTDRDNRLVQVFAKE